MAFAFGKVLNTRVFFGAFLSGAVLFAAPSGAQERNFRQEASDRVLPNAKDSYVVTVRVLREGYDLSRSTHIKSGETSQSRAEWRHGYMTTSARLVTLDGGPALGDTSVMVDLAAWQGLVDYWYEHAEKNKSYKPFYKALRKRLKVAKGLAEDAETVLRVLEGLEFYDFIEDRHWEPDSEKPSSGPAFVLFEGASGSIEFVSPHDPPRTEVEELEPWRTGDPTDAIMYPADKFGLIVWRYTPEDMARVNALAARVEEFRADLELDLSDIRARGWTPEMLETIENHIHWAFRDPFIAGIHEVLRLAWNLAPAEAPAGHWAQSRDRLDPAYTRFAGAGYSLGTEFPGEAYLSEIRGLRYLDRDAKLELPPLPTDTLIQLSIPQFGFGTSEPVKPQGSNVQFRPNSYWTEEYKATLGSSTRERYRLGRDGFHGDNQSLIHAAVEGERFSGRLILTMDYAEESFDNSRAWENYDEEHQTYTIVWSAEHNGEIWKPRPVTIAPSLVALKDGDYVPLEGPLAFGDAFAVEGRLEEPAARRVYRLSLEHGGAEPFEVFLYPTEEEDRKLLRSDIHYLMWDVAPEERDAEDGETAEADQ